MIDPKGIKVIISGYGCVMCLTGAPVLLDGLLVLCAKHEAVARELMTLPPPKR